MFQSFAVTARPEQGPPRLAALRQQLEAEDLAGFLIPRADAHQGEYVSARDERLSWLTGFTGSAGFNGIVAALFGGLHPLWTIPSSFLFGSLLTGATELQRELQIPNALAIALNGLIVLFVVSSDRVRGWLDTRLDARMRTGGSP